MNGMTILAVILLAPVLVVGWAIAFYMVGVHALLNPRG